MLPSQCLRGQRGFDRAALDAQIRDPYYKFSRDPDMSLDTAPYPAGVPKPGTYVVRSITCLTAMHVVSPLTHSMTAQYALLGCHWDHRPARTTSIVADCKSHAAQAANGDSALVGARVKTGQVQYITALVECVQFPHAGVAYAALLRVVRDVAHRGSANLPFGLLSRTGIPFLRSSALPSQVPAPTASQPAVLRARAVGPQCNMVMSSVMTGPRPCEARVSPLFGKILLQSLLQSLKQRCCRGKGWGACASAWPAGHPWHNSGEDQRVVSVSHKTVADPLRCLITVLRQGAVLAAPMVISNTLPTAVSQFGVVDGGVLHLRSAL